MKTVFITRKLPNIAEQILSKYFKVVINKTNQPITRRKLLEVVSKYDAILSTISDRLSADIIAKKKNLQVISNYAVGVNNIDVKFAQRNGIAVYNTPDVVTQSTADMTFALLLSLVRKIDEARHFVKKNKWSGWNPEIFLGEELSGKTLGIIGFGRVGQAVAKRAIGFGLHVIFCDRLKSKSHQLIGVGQQVKFKTLLEKSDYISLHVPLQKDTRYLINKKSISWMKKKPIIINTARGEIIETDSLVNALRKRYVRGACLDVTDPEPIKGNHPLTRIKNCIVVPHIGTATVECRYAMAKMAAENIINHFV
ncbi:MAG: D-glycerate dehydrogenase [Patescibacteria group bacterium]